MVTDHQTAKIFGFSIDIGHSIAEAIIEVLDRLDETGYNPDNRTIDGSANRVGQKWLDEEPCNIRDALNDLVQTQRSYSRDERASSADPPVASVFGLAESNIEPGATRERRLLELYALINEAEFEYRLKLKGCDHGLTCKRDHTVRRERDELRVAHVTSLGDAARALGHIELTFSEFTNRWTSWVADRQEAAHLSGRGSATYGAALAVHRYVDAPVWHGFIAPLRLQGE